MVRIDDFEKEVECEYRKEIYSVRDNGAVMRHSKEGRKARLSDNIWTMGKPDKNTGYLFISGERVHRIVATAFHGVAPTKEHVVDHIDTNRQNNRAENLRWLTKLENILLNPITLKKIELVCGSIEAFLENPSLLKQATLEPNIAWMRTVTEEEAIACYKNLMRWARSDKTYSGGSLGEWIYRTRRSYENFEDNSLNQEAKIFIEKMLNNERAKLLDSAEIIRCTGGGMGHSYFKCSRVLDEVQDLECLYCDYRIDIGASNDGCCFWKAWETGIRTKEDLLSITDIKRNGDDIVRIVYNRKNKLITKEFKTIEKERGKTIFELWDERTQDKIIVRNMYTKKWLILIEEDPRISFQNKGKVWAKLNKSIEDLQNCEIRAIGGAEQEVWEIVK